MKKREIILAVTLILIAAAGRLVPHPWNATPLTAVSLFAGSRLSKRGAMLVPILSLFISDIIIGFYQPMIMFSVYFSFSVIGMLGIFIHRRARMAQLFVTAIVASTLFFFLTNIAVWYATPLYEKTYEGLAAALVAGIPFYRNMLAGDLFYTLFLFVFAQKMYPHFILFLREKYGVAYAHLLQWKTHRGQDVADLS